MLRAVVLTQYRRVTDGQTDRQTDGIAVASTALAMRALRHAVKTEYMNGNTRSNFQELDKATEGEACAPNGRQQNTATVTDMAPENGSKV